MQSSTQFVREPLDAPLFTTLKAKHWVVFPAEGQASSHEADLHFFARQRFYKQPQIIDVRGEPVRRVAEKRIAFPNELDHAIQAGPVPVSGGKLVRESLVQVQAVELPQFLLVERAHTQVADLKTPEAERQATREAQRQLDAKNARRPWVLAALLLLTLGLCTTLWFYVKARQQERVIVKANDFLNDVLGQANPATSNNAAKTLREAVLEAAPNIDREFSSEPAMAPRLHKTIADALSSLSDYGDAGREFDTAAMRWTEANGALSQQAMAAQFEHAGMDARSYEPQSLDRAHVLFAREQLLSERLRDPSVDLEVKRLSAAGNIALASADTKKALVQYERAYQLATADSTLARKQKLTLQQRLCVMEMKAGQYARAEVCDRHLIDELHTAFGSGANTNMPEIALTQALLLQAKDREAISEATKIYPAITASLGPDNNLTLQVLATRAAAEGTLEMWDASIADDLAVAQSARKQDPHGLLAIGALSDAALSECRHGQAQQGETHARQSLKEANADGINPGATGGVAYTVVSCILADWQQAIAPTRLDKADKLLKQIDIPAVEAVTANQDWGANVILYQAVLAAKRKQVKQARGLLAKAAQAFAGKEADPYSTQQFRTLDHILNAASVNQ